MGIKEEPLTKDEHAYFDELEHTRMSDHDLLMRHDATLFAPATGLAMTVLRNTVTLYGDGTKEHPGIVNVIWEHLRNQEQNDKKRQRSIQLTVAIVGALILIVDRLLPLIHWP